MANSFGTVANIVLLLVMAIHQRLRQSSNWALIANCIVIDLYATSIAMPLITIPLYLGHTWQLPGNFCKYQSLFIYVIYAASMYASVVLAVQRLVATILPHSFAIMTKRTCLPV